MTDIVERLEKNCPCSSDIGCADALCLEAATEITRLRAENERLSTKLSNTASARVLQGKAIAELRAENERLRAALIPFAEEVKNWDAYAASNDLWDGIVEGYKVTITMSDCRRAAAALKENSDE